MDGAASAPEARLGNIGGADDVAKPIGHRPSVPPRTVELVLTRVPRAQTARGPADRDHTMPALRVVAARSRRPAAIALVVLLLLGLLSTVGAVSAVLRSVSRPSRVVGSSPSAADARNELPLSFVANAGGLDARVRYVAHGPGFGAFFTDDAAVLSFVQPPVANHGLAPTTDAQTTDSRTTDATNGRGYALGLAFVGANRAARLEPSRISAGRANFIFRGRDPARWRTGLPAAGALTYRDLWPGVDMAFSGDGQRLDYELRLAAGARPDAIRLAYRGATGLTLDGHGNLRVATPMGTLTDSAPVSYQDIGGRRVAVTSRYVLGPDGTYGFELGAHDRRRPVVIDPTLVYSTYLHGNNSDTGNAVAVDSSGNAYVTGYTTSNLFPSTTGVIFHGSLDVFVTKLDPAGANLVYSTFVGGSGVDVATGIAVDGSGDAYLIGSTSSTDFPATGGAFQATLAGGFNDAFVAALGASGAVLTYATYLGGTGGENGNGIAVDATGDAYVTGSTSSTDFPTTPGAFQTTAAGSNDTFVTEVNASGSALVFSTYLGGSASDIGIGIAVDGSGDAYVAGATQSSDLPTTGGAFDTAYGGGGQDGFVTEVNGSGTGLVFSTYMGGSGQDQANSVAVNGAGNAYVVGTTSQDDFPTASNALGPLGGGDAFVTELNPAGSGAAYFSYLGGNAAEQGQSIAIDGGGNAYVTGNTLSSDFPTTANAFQSALTAGSDVFVGKLNPLGTALLYSTYLGGSGNEIGNGIALNGADNVYVAGLTISTNFPTTPGAFDAGPTGGPASHVFASQLNTPPTAPGAPVIGTATPHDASASVTFAAPVSDGGSPINFYTVTATDSTTPGNGGQTASDVGSPITVAGLTNGDSYTLTVAATNGVGTGPDSAPSNAAVPTAPATPALAAGAPTITGVSPGDASVVVSFAPGMAGSSATTGFGASCTSIDAGINGAASGPGSPIVVSGLTNGKTYTCSVVASDADGTASDPSGPSAQVVPSGGTTTGDTCTPQDPCSATAPTPATASAPAESATVTGIPSSATGSVNLSPGPPRFTCPNSLPTQALSTTLTDEGFSPATTLTVTVTQQAAATSPGKICFSSTTPFLSVTSPTTPKAGTAVLLPCSAVGNSPPCQVSSTQTKSRISVRFRVRGGDPVFKLVLPSGRLLWPSVFPSGKVGTAYASHMQSSGGKAPVRWKIASGKLAPGLKLNGSTGAVTGTPTTKGTFGCEVQATDSESPPKKANLAVSITIK